MFFLFYPDRLPAEKNRKKTGKKGSPLVFGPGKAIALFLGSGFRFFFAFRRKHIFYK